MTTFRDVVPTTYINHDDLKGKDHTLTIKGFEVEEMFLRGQRQKKTRPVLYFQEAKKGLVVNVTINATLKRLFSTAEMEEWIGRRITIFPTTDDTGGETKQVVRVRPTLPADKPAATPPAAGAGPAEKPAEAAHE